LPTPHTTAIRRRPGRLPTALSGLRTALYFLLPAVVALLLACGTDPNQALVEGASLGRDADTITSVLGGIIGGLHGASALRPDWIGDCERANADFFAEVNGDPTAGFHTTATRLVSALETQRDTVRQRLDTLNDLLGPAA
jgi:ADP-ribosylglycohydrolase